MKKMIPVLSLLVIIAFKNVNAESAPAKVDGDYKSGDLTVESGSLKQEPFKLMADFSYVKRNNAQDGAGMRFEFNKKLHLAPSDSAEPGAYFEPVYAFSGRKLEEREVFTTLKDRFSVVAISPDLKLDLQTKGKDISRLDLSGAQVSLLNYELRVYKDANKFERGKVPTEYLNQTLSISGASAIAIFKDVKDIGLSQKGVQFSLAKVTYHGALKIAGVNFDGCIGLDPINATAGTTTGRGEKEGLNRINSKIIACAGVNLQKVAHIGYQFAADIGWDGARTLSHEVAVSQIGHDKNPVRITGSSRTDTNANGVGVTTNTVGFGMAF